MPSVVSNGLASILKIGSTTRRLVATVALAVLSGRLLLIPSETSKRDTEVRAAYEAYRYCTQIDVLCAPSQRCSYLNCIGDFLRRSEEISRRRLLLSVLKPRHLLSGWQPVR